MNIIFKCFRKIWNKLLLKILFILGQDFMNNYIFKVIFAEGYKIFNR